MFISAGILSSIAIYTNLAGFLSSFFQKLGHLLIGTGISLLPLFLLYLGYSYLKGRGKFDLGKGFFGVALLCSMLVLIFGTIYIQSCEYPDSFSGNFFAIVNDAADEANTLNGGIIGYMISYPLYKLVGFIGSYIIYVAALIISAILSFNFSVFRLSEIAKIKGMEYREKGRRLKDQRFSADSDEDFIKIKSKNKGKNTSDNRLQSKSEFLKGVDNKIKILDFMKNSAIDDYEDEMEESSLDNDDFIKENKKRKLFEEAKEAKKRYEAKVAEEKQESEVENRKLKVFNKSKGEVIEVEPEVVKSEPEIVQSKHEGEVRRGKKDSLDNMTKDVMSKEIDNSLMGEENAKEYVFPSTDLLEGKAQTELNSTDKKELIASASKLEETLGSFGVEAKVLQVSKGPSVTRFELQPSPGVKVSKIVNLSDDIALGLAASGVRIEAPIPGKSAVGIEVPNKKQTAVLLREVLDSNEFINSKAKLAFALGKDIGGACVVGDLSKMPHTLIAGATGSGKSVCINSLIISILYKYSPDDVKLLMVDPKVVELNVYNGIPHLLIPVVTDPKKAAAALNWAVNEMTKRYNLFAEKGVRNIDSYNGLYKKGLVEEKMPYIVIIVDELADLMMVCPHDVEDYIGRLAQMARAAGMHLVIATQRPSVDVITGVIKANIPSRISFAVSSQVDSRTILDSSGAEKLLGRGDMLYAPVGENKPLRVQGCFISEEEVERVVEFIKNGHEEVKYEESIIDEINSGAQGSSGSGNDDDADELLPEAIKMVVEYEQASTSFLQRRLRIGFNRASRIMDELEERGVISPKDGSRPRQVLIGKDALIDDASENNEI
ncbi:MAG: DNA translocase FtsK [Clostridium sp.]|nr:DNA translocase FtsK [Clostridium sp.]